MTAETHSVTIELTVEQMDAWAKGVDIGVESALDAAIRAQRPFHAEEGDRFLDPVTDEYIACGKPLGDAVLVQDEFGTVRMIRLVDLAGWERVSP